MGALKIECDCTESQMDKIVQFVSSRLDSYDNIRDIEDIDEEVEGYRVCVDFDIAFDQVSIKDSEILNSDWDVLPEDTAVLTSRLRDVINNYNNCNISSVNQSKDIRSEQEYSLLHEYAL